MTLWALILAVIVFGGVYLIWDVRMNFRRNARLIERWTDRVQRYTEDRAWTLRQTEYQRAMLLTLRRQRREVQVLLTGDPDPFVESLEVVQGRIAEVVA